MTFLSMLRHRFGAAASLRVLIGVALAAENEARLGQQTQSSGGAGWLDSAMVQRPQ